MFLDNKVVLITGGTGSFGRQFVRIVLQKSKPKKMIIYSRDEMKQYDMQRIFNDSCMRYFIGDVRDGRRLHRAFHGVNVVIHAAAIKIVPTAEYNPFEAVKTNVLGAENVINAAIDNGVELVIGLSTDKAANPINLYGATKLCAEKVFVAANNYAAKRTKFSVVRYGNVFGSRGSVVPLFRQCRASGIVPITDRRMTRFWITLPEGVHFVLNRLEHMQGGEIFVPKLPSIKIVDLAEAIVPGCELRDVGIRPGEKIHETLVSGDEGLYTYEHRGYFEINSRVAAPPGKTVTKDESLGSEFAGYTSINNLHWLTVSQLHQMIEREIKEQKEANPICQASD